MSKLSIVNERPGLGMDTSWSETGDRYLLKLFRDHVFHQVSMLCNILPWKSKLDNSKKLLNVL